jgi:hypothetical protein
MRYTRVFPHRTRKAPKGSNINSEYNTTFLPNIKLYVEVMLPQSTLDRYFLISEKIWPWCSRYKTRPQNAAGGSATQQALPSIAPSYSKHAIQDVPRHCHHGLRRCGHSHREGFNQCPSRDSDPREALHLLAPHIRRYLLSRSLRARGLLRLILQQVGALSLQ